MKNIKWYDKEVKKEVLDKSGKAVLKGCFWVQGDAMKMVHFITTRLRGSTSVNWSGSGLQRGKVKAPAEADDGIGQPTTKTDAFTGVVGSNVEYARRYDMGFVGTDSLGRNYNQAPRPYLRVSLEKNRSRILKSFKNLIK